MIKCVNQCSAFFFLTVLVTSCLAPLVDAHAQSIPSTAEVDRQESYRIDTYKIEPAPVAKEQKIPDGIRYSQPPPNADQIKLFVNSVMVEGVTIYSQDEISRIFRDDLGKEVTLDRIWRISDEITKKYRKDGYFLSRAFIPAQEINNGKIVIKVVEGYIKEIGLEENTGDLRVIKGLNKELLSHKPVSSKDMERYHFLLTDLAGLQNLHGTLAPLPGRKDGGVHLIYTRNDTPTSSGYVGINNFGSQYLGPAQTLAYWQGSLLPLQDTFIAVRTTMPADEMVTINASHTLPLTADTSITISAGLTKANPGFTLTPQEIESRSIDAGITITHKIIRQRLENWSASLGIDGRNSKSTILDTTELSEDKVRALRLSSIYDTYDRTGAYNRGKLTLSRGLNALGSSKESNLNLSRDGAEPDFTKLEAEYLRYQPLPYSMAMTAIIKGQKASGSLYSSEEFGFGGSEMGRAYDSSEITGDDGIAASIEAQYNGVPELGYFQIQPYAFYDIGKVWNRNGGQIENISASSTGLGVRIDHTSGVKGSFQISFPLTKQADTPIYGASQDGPRAGFQLGYQF